MKLGRKAPFAMPDSYPVTFSNVCFLKSGQRYFYPEILWACKVSVVFCYNSRIANHFSQLKSFELKLLI